MPFFKKISLLALVIIQPLGAFAQLIQQANEHYPNGIAAVVDDKIITMDELHLKLAPFIPQLKRECRSQEEFVSKIDETGRKILESMVDNIILTLDFKKRGAEIPESFLNNHINNLLKEQFQDDRTRFQEYLKAQGITERDFRQQQNDEIIVGYLQNEIRKSQSEVSPERIERYYKEHENEFRQEDAVELYQVTLSPKLGQPAQTLADKANLILEKLRRGIQLSEIANELNDKNLEKAGMDFGWVIHSDIRKELAESAFKLEKGQFSEPVKIDNSLFILYAKDKRQAGTKSLAEVRDYIENQIVSELTKTTQETKLKRIRKNYFIKYYI